MRPSVTRWFTIAVAALMAAGVSLLHAQGVTTAAIYGNVTDNAGNPLPGANILATHVPSGTIYGTTSRENGDYNLPGLRVGGPYAITASYVGYAKEEASDIQLQLSQSLRLDFKMKEEAIRAGEVVVTAERGAVLSAARTGAATNVVREQIDRLPTITRTFADYFKLSPYFSGIDSRAAGRNNRYNNIQVDGSNFNDMFGLGGTGVPGGQGGVTPITLDAIEEFQIVVSPFDVRQAGFTGAGVNAITRSGTNTLMGSAFYYSRNENFSGVSPDALKAKLPSFSDYSAGFRLGGPIIENKFFFFGAGEMARRETPFTRTFNQAAFGTNAYTAYADSLKILSDFLKSKYGYETGPWGSITPFNNSDKIFLRFDYNLSASHKLTARWNYLNSSDHNSPSRFRGTADIYSENSAYELRNKTHSFAVQLTSVFGNSASNELIAGYVDQFDNPVFLGQPFPVVEINTYGAGGTLNRLAVGSEEFRHYNELGQKVLELTDNFSYYLPNHTITVGAKLDFIKFRNLFIPDGFGLYRYNSVAAFLAGGRAASYAYRYSATSNPAQEANWSYQQFGFYAQDEWTVSPTFKLVGGVRIDVPMYTDKPNNNPTFESTFSSLGLKTSEPPTTSVSISPRLGFNWTPDEERNVQLRGGLGVFYGRYPAVWVSNQYSNTGVDFYTVSTPPSSFIADPYGQPKIATGLPTAEVNITDPNFKAPSILRFNLALDHRLPYDLVASVEGIFSKSINEVYYQNINLAGIKGTIPGENRARWSNYSATTGAYTSTGRTVSSAFTAVYLVKNTDQGSNANVIVQLQRQNIADGFYANLGYNWGMAKDIGGTNSTTASSGWRFNPTPGNPNDPVLSFADGDRRHRIFGTVSYRFNWGDGFGFRGLATTVGIFYNGISGRPFSYIVNGDVNGDALSDNDLAYIPRDQSDIILVTSAGAAAPQSDYDALFAYINNDEYLKERKGQMSERNAARSPWSQQVDLRVTQEIPSFSGQKVELTFDVLNVLNLLNREWGWVKLANDTRLLNFHSIDPASGRARYRWTNVTDPNIASNTLSRWTAQFGVRYTF